MNRKSFINRSGGIGALLRVYESKPEGISRRLEMAEKTLNTLRSVIVDGVPIIKEIVFLVWADPRYRGSDCGETDRALENKFLGRSSVKVLKVTHGGVYCDTLNEGIYYLNNCGKKYALILSTEAESYVNSETLTEMVDAICAGALVTGAAINEIYQSVLEGRVANTFAIWEVKALTLGGGFDAAGCEKPLDELHADWRCGFDITTNQFVYYPRAGVEEIVPLIKIFRKYGRPMIAPIVPFGAGGERYNLPTDPEELDRNRRKFATKETRQFAHAASLGCDLSYLKGAVMPAYRNW